MKKLILLTIFVLPNLVFGGQGVSAVNEVYDHDGLKTEMYHAVKRGDINFVKKHFSEYISKGVSYGVDKTGGKKVLFLPSINSKGNTLLHIATKFGRSEIVEFLFKKGAHLSLKNVQDKTPLYLALKKDHLDLAKLMIKAEVHIDQESIDLVRKRYVNSLKIQHQDFAKFFKDTLDEQAKEDAKNRLADDNGGFYIMQSQEMITAALALKHHIKHNRPWSFFDRCRKIFFGRR